ncbi:hypothetical protein FisN_9Hu125 [Fistulifera solaris]|uniref:Uncharacterized protein n=1 Tax=Fistulifera solaris TaxID=1519565 RepID=A0A1Z5K2C6_FISSO|nr:hypothetical protein FisN_9Hu125 [Fistulifera solaris]|eukprot:GAX20405.1 hypothetical protein FisN_9Hu125 [Fistulifera solaris]
MRLSTKRDYLSCSQSDLATSDCKRQRTEGPVQSLFASLWSPVDVRDDKDDDLRFPSDSFHCESIPDDEMSFILSFAESREEMQSWICENENAAWAQSTVQALLSLNVTTSRGSSGCSSLRNHRASRRVQFAPGFYTVTEIPHHNSLTADEKCSLYRNGRALQAEKDKICLEIKFERRLRLCGAADALEEGCFFRDHLGELVHPAHWLVKSSILDLLIRNNRFSRLRILSCSLCCAHRIGDLKLFNRSLSFAESREEMQSWIYENENAAWAQSTVQALLSVNVTTSRGSSGCSSRRNHRASRRVRFAPGFYTVKEIPHHNLLTADEKRSLYRDKRTLQAEKDDICFEIKFERRLRLCGAADALEEGCFFRDHLGELVHPAHWLVYVNEILTSLSLDTPVVGFLSLNEYKQSDEFSKYEQYFDNSMREKVFHPRSLDS